MRGAESASQETVVALALDRSGRRAAKRMVVAVAARPGFGRFLAVAFVARTVVAAVFTDLDRATANIWEYGNITRVTLEHG